VLASSERCVVDGSERQLPGPPVARIRAEFPAIIEPPLRDIPESTGLEIEGGFELFKGERQEVGEHEEVLDRVREVALGDERVRQVLGDGRFTVVGISHRVDDKERREPTLVLVAYSYDKARGIEVRLEGESAELRVSEVLEVDYQPPPSDEELEQAIELARRAVGDRLRDDYEAMPILTSDVESGDRHHGRRRFVVGFGPADERQPRVRTLVDLGAERVLAVETSEIEREDEEPAK
jgi:hypothetical protein